MQTLPKTVTESWRPIVGYEGWYEVSDQGRVRSADRVLAFTDGRVRAYKGKVLAQYPDEFGYLKVTLKKQDSGNRIHVHVIVAAAFIGPRPEGLQVCHNEGDHLDNRPSEMRYGTVKANHADIKRHGRQNRHRKLSDEVVTAIREARGKLTGAELALLFGTSSTHVCNIQAGHRRT